MNRFRFTVFMDKIEKYSLQACLKVCRNQNTNIFRPMRYDFVMFRTASVTVQIARNRKSVFHILNSFLDLILYGFVSHCNS